MAVVEENWQTKRSTIVERTSFTLSFNSQLLSDIKFVVPVSTGESERQNDPSSQVWACNLQSFMACSDQYP